jgi:hypothetical protein
LRVLLDGLAIPVPKLSAAIALGLGTFSSELIINLWLIPGGGGELTEFNLVYCIAATFFLPANAELFRVPNTLPAEPVPLGVSGTP